MVFQFRGNYLSLMAGPPCHSADLVPFPHPIATFYKRYLLEMNILLKSGTLSEGILQRTIHCFLNLHFFRYFIISKAYLKGALTTIGLAVMPSLKQSHDFKLNLGELKVSLLSCTFCHISFIKIIP